MVIFEITRNLHICPKYGRIQKSQTLTVSNTDVIEEDSNAPIRGSYTKDRTLFRNTTVIEPYVDRHYYMTNASQKRHTDRQRIILAAGYTDFSKGLNRYARSRTHNTDTADDLVQNTFLKTWKYLVKGGKVDMMEAFLYHILKALVIDEYRKKKSTSLDVLIDKGFEVAVDETERLTNIFDGRQAIDLIDKLPFLYQKIIRLRYVNDLSIKEIALITGQTRNTVAVQAHRGLEQLRVLHAVRIAQSTLRIK